MSYNIKKVFLFFTSLFIFYYIGSSYYMYYFDCLPPVINYEGIVDGKYYNGNITVKIAAEDKYKIKHFSLQLDEKVLVNNQAINSSKMEYPLLIPTIHLLNGSHTLVISVVDASKNKNETKEVIHFNVDNEPLEINILKSNNTKVNQGNVFHIQLQSNKKIKNGYVKTLNYQVPIILESNNSSIYEAYIPISTEEICGKYIATIYIEDNVENIASYEYEYEILPTVFKKQYIQLKNKKNELINLQDREPSEDINISLKEAAIKSPAKKLWQGSFYKPCLQSPLTTEFGVIRTSFEKGRYRHDAVDYAAIPKSPVWACQDGIVVLKNYNDGPIGFGNCVAIDHGIGLISIYAHLDSFSNIEIGQFVKKGTILGTVGMTGYATGYHLHWEMRLCDVKINPLEWIKDDL
jgi:murein DD-endopeptidase MepM/ murein hydrolase activator NlpD